MLHAYNNPSTVKTEDEWIQWVFSLRQVDARHALQFVEDWSGIRIAVVGSIPWTGATIAAWFG